MGGKSSAPSQPDYAAAAQQQGGANLQSAIATNIMNRPTEQTPYGTRSWTQSGTTRLDNLTGVPAMEVPNFTSSIQFTPEGQALFGKENAMKQGLADLGVQSIGTVQGVMGSPFRFDGPDVQMSAGQRGDLDLSGVARMPVNAGMTAQNAIMSRLQPQMERSRELQRTQLINQGLRPGMEAYDQDVAATGRQENDLLTQAALQGIGVDMNANQQGYNQALQTGQFGNQAALQNATFGNQAQAQALAQALYQRNLPLNEITALMSGSQVAPANFQNFYTGANVGAAPMFGAAQAQGQAGMNAANLSTAERNAMIGGLAQLGGMGLYGYGMRK